MKTIRDILVLHHTHTDIGYTHPQPVFWELSRRFIDEAIDLCERTAGWPEPCRAKWTCEVTAATMHWLRHAGERQIERMRALVKAGQISFGALFCNGTTLASAEELAQSLCNIRLLREAFGAPVSVAITHDVNGLPWPLVGLLRDAGVESVLMGINIHSGMYPFGVRPRAFRWEGPDGREVLAWSGEHYNMFNQFLGRWRNHELGPAGLRKGLESYLQRLAAGDYPYDFLFLTATHPWLPDNAPPDPDLPALAKAWNDLGEGPVLRLVTPETLFARLREIPADVVEKHRGDWPDAWSFGAASSAMDTAVNRRNHSAWSAAQLLDTALPPDEGRAARLREGFWNLAIADEHTWGAFCSTAHFAGLQDLEPVPVAEQWAHKAAYIHTARSLLNLARRDALEAISGQPRQAHGGQGVLVFNASAIPRRAIVRVPKEWIGAAWRHSTSTVQSADVMKPLLRPATTVAVGPVEVPPFSLVTIPAAQIVPATVAPGIVADKGVLRTSRFELRFNPESGRIASLTDVKLKRSLLDAGSPHELFGYVRETVAEKNPDATNPEDLREAIYVNDWDGIHVNQSCWNPSWKARHETPEACTRAEAVALPEGAALVREYRAAGVTLLRQTITLLEHEETIRFEAYFHKTDHVDPESIYFAFPLDVANRRVHYDSAGAAVEYGVEQLPGTTRDFIPAYSWIAAHNAEVCICLACPDAPNFQTGGFTFGRCLDRPRSEEKSLLLAWALNNYWGTNFRASQPGPIRLAYEMKVLPAFDSAACARFGLGALSDLELHPLAVCAGAGVQTLLVVEGEDVIATQCKRAEDGDGLVVRLVNHAGEPRRARVSLPGRVPARACLSDTLEQLGAPLPVQGGAVETVVPARAVVNVRLWA
jgi:alpha-mannosidase